MASKNRDASDWRSLLNRQAQSGLSVRRFCAKAGVSEPSFYAWRRKFRASRDVALPKEHAPAEEPGSGCQFIPLKLLDSTSVLELIHPLGYQIRVTGDVNVHGLRQVLDLLDGRQDR